MGGSMQQTATVNSIHKFYDVLSRKRMKNLQCSKNHFGWMNQPVYCHIDLKTVTFIRFLFHRYMCMYIFSRFSTLNAIIVMTKMKEKLNKKTISFNLIWNEYELAHEHCAWHTYESGALNPKRNWNTKKNNNNKEAEIEEEAKKNGDINNYFY